MKKLITLWIILPLLALTACSNGSFEKYSRDSFVLGTFTSITIYSDHEVPEQIFEDLQNKLKEIETTMTINADVNSEIEQINNAAGKEAVKVSEDTFYVIKTAYEFTKKTEGRFDITVGALVKLWNIGFENAKVPSEEAITSALQNIGIEDVALNEEDHSVKLEREGMLIDLGAIAKGYAADAIVKILKENGYEKAIINLGGNVICIGVKPDGNPFKVGIRDPQGEATTFIGIVTVRENSVVTSGIYERNFVENDILYHHILDTITGFPVDNNLESVTIITEKSIDADALSTGVFSMGLERGFEFVQQLEGVDAIFVTKNQEIVLTEGAKEIFNLTSDDYKLVEIGQEQK